MTMQQCVNVMRKAGCEIFYTPNIMYGSKLIAYIARCKETALPVGFWFADEESGSISVNGKIIMSWEFTE